MNQDVRVSASGRLRRITLNRPERLHSLTASMCSTMLTALAAWRDDPEVTVVVIDHQPGTRGFCAGGDVRALAEAARTEPAAAARFFRTEYQLNHLLFTFPKPVVTVMDGITMGGGAGLALPAGVRIATERTVFAMPEVHTGLFPDVGAGWHLTRRSTAVGRWLGLTGSRLKAADCLRLGIATHYVSSTKLAALNAALDDSANQSDPVSAVRQVVDQVQAECESPAGEVDDHLVLIEKIFGLDSLEGIVNGLEENSSPWAQEQAAALRSASPLSLEVTFEQLQRATAMNSFADELAQEYRLAVRMVAQPDFGEAVAARMVDKDREPRWNPPTPDAVSSELVKSMFERLAPGDEWTPRP
jgi:enoyl-CoA hydratase